MECHSAYTLIMTSLLQQYRVLTISPVLQNVTYTTALEVFNMTNPITTMYKIICLLISLLYLCGCASHQSTQTTVQDEGLVLIMTQDPSNTSHYSQEDLNGALTQGLSYLGVKDVSILLQGQEFPLDEAIQNGTISLSQILDKAHLDAKAGLCEEIVLSELGLTTFNFSYKDHNVQIIQDIFETPDGTNPLITFLRITSTIYAPGTITGFLNHDRTSQLDKEDWGLTFEVSSISNTSLTITCDQTGGQQIGKLLITCIMITQDGKTPILTPNGDAVISYNQEITMDAETIITLNWSDFYEDIHDGTYALDLIVEDKYSSLDVHPLMRNYHDTQIYRLSITIP